MSATTTQLLSSGEFRKLRYDTIPVKSASADVSFYNNDSKMPNSELWHSCCKWVVYIYIYIYIYIYKSNFIHNISIKTINNDTFKQLVETKALVHSFIGNGNTLINSQPSSERFWSLFFSHVSNLSCHQQMATFHFITTHMHNNKYQSISHLFISIQLKFKKRSSQASALHSFPTSDNLKSIQT